jgi:hypothetical protein
MKVKFPLCLTKYHGMKTYIHCLIKHHAMQMHGGMKAQIHAFLTIAVNVRGEWSASRPPCIKPTPE